MVRPHRNQALWYAYMAHRVSGVGLAIFLPLHFYVLGMALEGTASLDGFLNWAQLPMVKLVEFGLVFALAVHLFGGLRLLALEFLPWSPRQKTYAAVAVAGSFFIACSFLLNAV
ncbi:MAG: fumarate reductase subunit D [Gammaproteobacteria bacterium]|jgi:fumarate reductase subunit D